MKQLLNYTVLVVLFLSGCGPVFRTEYKYQPISSSSGGACANGCLDRRTDCERDEEERVRDCEIRAEDSYNYCESNKIYGYNKKGKYECLESCYCSRPSCSSADYDRCEKLHADCYVNCGGKVTVITRCVENCEKVVNKESTQVRSKEPARSKARTPKK